MVAAFLGYALDEAKRELQRRPFAQDDDVTLYLADLADSAIGRLGDLTEPEKRQLWGPLCTALLPYIPATGQ